MRLRNASPGMVTKFVDMGPGTAHGSVSYTDIGGRQIGHMTPVLSLGNATERSEETKMRQAEASRQYRERAKAKDA